MNKLAVHKQYYEAPIYKWATIYKDFTQKYKYFAYLREEKNEPAIYETISFDSNGITAEEIKKDFIESYMEYKGL